MKGMTLGEVMKSLGALAQEVAALGKTVAKLEGNQPPNGAVVRPVSARSQTCKLKPIP